MADDNGTGSGNGTMVVSWKMYTDARFDAVEKATNIALVAAKAAVDSALTEKDKSLVAAFAASEKAISKAEDSQRDYNKTIVELQKDIVSLKESRSQSGGKDLVHTEVKSQSNINIALIASVLFNVILLVVTYWKH